MREIKFRYWDKENNEMIDGDVLAFEEYLPIADHLNQEGITQYVGLKDKNGKEIYEGDIVKISNHPFEGSMKINGNYEVGYNEYMELCCGSLLLFRNKHYAEVIGNVFENPELIR